MCARLKRDPVSRAKHQKPVFRVRHAANRHGAGQNIGRAFLGNGIKRAGTVGCDMQVHIQGFRRHRHRCPEPGKAADNHPSGNPVAGKLRQLSRVGMKKGRVHLFLPVRQGQPGLHTGKPAGSGAFVMRGALGMDNATARCHQVQVTGTDHHGGAQTVAMRHMALKQIGYGGQPDMRMRAHIKGIVRRQLRRSHPVKEDKRPHHASLHGRQRPPHLKPAKIGRARDDQMRDPVGHGPVAGQGIVTGKERHGGSCQILES